MKNLILSGIVVVSMFSSCSKEDVTNNEKMTDKGQFKSSILNKNNSSKIAGKEYMDQLPYLDAHTDFMAFNVENDLGHKMNDPKIDWKTLNSLYSSDLSTASKQYLIYILFAKKDLLGIQDETPSKDQEDIIKEYTKELVNTKYFGYCLLYNALSVLNNDSENTALVKDLANQISVYSESEKFHSDFLSKPTGREKWIEKVKEDYSYLDKIKGLQ
ncbi:MULTISPECIES: hypothetical protein [Chryseobacterium]|uniref:Lipoprotein n=1 Tax=Chryseobacterium camelliae TaxID=1265445 RepID=A0ABU0TER4_9FLAO|nr:MULTISPECIES: hypothetical protein [Chryseobacterium]MDT3406646.1 hypothetical protein [Pseudacidovorax intermedius]MDQ1095557.1 hypothetical protein [Chryseobacterium camelliae]MDQ1099494.1 hypothetical protein [Chryseobacterium sp. SORGH_AS_1048]MDR6086841.1 hypothetical protein [Chryseobacterium sp. SORGH_AS_0909]MDR6131212.1 hypothetical protein [Chryseobacterium sp. SORGH_AS_1175]